MTKKSKGDEPISWAELVKRVVYAGIGGAAMAHEAVSDTKKRREVIDVILSKAERRKDEIVEILAREVSKFLGKINVSDEVTKALKGLVINLNASIDFKEKKGGGLTPTATIHSADAHKKES